MHASANEQTIGVFLVDDHKCMLWGLERLVAGEQPRMRVAGKASSRAEALAGVRAAAPNVILLDLDLGGSNSLDFLPELMEQSEAQVLVLTGTRDRSLLERAVSLGASGIVLKDESADVLVRAIERVHQGELWLGRSTMARVLGSLTQGGRSTADKGRPKVEPLTPKEKQIVAAVVRKRGAKSEVVASDLHMSGHTLRNHLTTIYRKLDVRNRLELVMFALENGLVAEDGSSAGKTPRVH